MTANNDTKIEIGTEGEQNTLRLTQSLIEDEFSLTPEQRNSLEEGPALPIVNELIQTELDQRINPMSNSERIKKGIGSFALAGTCSGLIMYGLTKDTVTSSLFGIYFGAIGSAFLDSQVKNKPYAHNQRLLSRTDALRKAYRLFPYEPKNN